VAGPARVAYPSTLMRAMAVGLVIAMGLAWAVPAPAHANELVPYPAIGYRNGKKLKLALVQVGWAEVELKTAKAFLAMRDAALVDGVELVIRSGWRSHERQGWLYQAWKQGFGNKAAPPGYSNHQAGRALDIYLDEPTFAWLEQHGRRFGFRRTVRGEPWHWEFFGVPKKARRAKARRPAARQSG
jgi:D-alanyl-D-alanine carboxypeptidase